MLSMVIVSAAPRFPSRTIRVTEDGTGPVTMPVPLPVKPGTPSIRIWPAASLIDIDALEPLRVMALLAPNPEYRSVVPEFTRLRVPTIAGARRPSRVSNRGSCRHRRVAGFAGLRGPSAIRRERKYRIMVSPLHMGRAVGNASAKQRTCTAYGPRRPVGTERATASGTGEGRSSEPSEAQWRARSAGSTINWLNSRHRRIGFSAASG